MNLIRVGWLLLAGFCFLPFPAEARRIVSGGRAYYSLDEVAYRYGMQVYGCRLANRYRNIVFQRDKRDLVINGVRYLLNFVPVVSGGVMYISRLDIHKQLDPVLRSQVVPNHPVRHIVLDPGHGGKDVGALGARYQEKKLTLSIAERVRARLIRAGYRVTVTRQRDQTLTLQQRASIARALKADLFLSIHINAVKNRSLAGIETYALTPAGAPSTSTGKISESACPGNEFDLNNLALANMIHRYLLSRTGGADRGVKRARFLVLREINMPGVLIECGFISNAAEELRLGTPEYQEKLARGIADGVTAYRYGIIKNPMRQGK